VSDTASPEPVQIAFEPEALEQIDPSEQGFFVVGAPEPGPGCATFGGLGVYAIRVSDHETPLRACLQIELEIGEHPEGARVAYVEAPREEAYRSACAWYHAQSEAEQARLEHPALAGDHYCEECGVCSSDTTRLRSYNEQTTPCPLVELAWREPPRCLAGFRAVPLKRPLRGMERSSELAYFELNCRCGGEHLFALGYLEDDDLFLGPLAAECATCSVVTELMNPEVHGYNGEIDSNSTMVGEGPRRRYPCPGCGEEGMRLFPWFIYRDERDEEWLESERPRQDYFGAFGLHGECRRCGRLCDVTSFECA
jgi:hypothetical protein